MLGKLLRKKIDWIGLAAMLVLTQGAGLLGVVFTVSSISTWYVTLNKPVWNPPNWVFGPVWTTLYVFMGVAAYLVWQKRGSREVGGVLRVYGIHLLANVFWSMIFFGWKDLGLALGEILVLWFLIAFLVVKYWQIDKRASLLMVPYLLWVSFASVLNWTIWQLNRGV